MAVNTMDAIKKRMQAMKLEKEAALDKASQSFTLCSIWSALSRAAKFSKSEEEVSNLQKRISQLENELDQAQEALAEATTKLEQTEKRQQDTLFQIWEGLAHDDGTDPVG